MTPRKGIPHWRPEEDAVLLLLYADRYSYAEMGRAIGRTRSAVFNRLIRLGVMASVPRTIERRNVIRLPVQDMRSAFGEPIPERVRCHQSRGISLPFVSLQHGGAK